MRNCSLCLAIVMLGCALGCGDNSRACGPGTTNEFGYCVPAATCGFGTKPDEETGECVPDGSIVCSDGTILNPLTGTCEIDPAACQNGTVLIANMCVDPTVGLVIDVQEGPEPNGLGVIEASDAQAGNIALKAIGGSAFVIHGTIDPHRDANQDTLLDPDVDTYVVTVAAPTLLKITADGVHGLTAGFVAVAVVGDNDPLADWQRFGINLSGDTSKRELFLPSAGTYRIAIADTRTLFEYAANGTSTAAPGDDDSEYYVSIEQIAVPTPTPLAVTSGTATLAGMVDSDALELYSVPMGTGLNTVSLAMPSAFTLASLVITNNNALRTTADEAAGPARAIVGRIEGGDTTVIVVDHKYNLSPSPVGFTLSVRISDATPLSGSGGTASALATTNTGTDFSRLNLFSLDVGGDDATIGLALTWSPPVVGQLYDDVGQRVAQFTAPTTSTTWTAYRGLIRVPTAGRYYFAVYAPSATSATMLNATSTITPLTPEVIVQGTPFVTTLSRAEPFSYDVGTDAWHQFNITGTGTGGQAAAWFDPATTYGRLDSLVTSFGTLAGEVTPIFTRTFPTGGGAIGRIVLDDPTTTYYVKVNPVNPTATTSAMLSFQKRANMVDLGAIAAGASAIRTGDTIDSANPARAYLFRAPVGSSVTITITPTSAVNTQFRRVRADETALGALINAANGPDVETFTQAGADWTAFVVSAAGGLSAARTFDVSVQIQ